MNDKLKVGQSFEVVEVLGNLGYSYLKGEQGICTKSFCFDGYDFEDFSPYTDIKPYLYKSELKPIGKLTITKLK